MPIGMRSYTSGNFELQLDGSPTTAYLKSVEGGWAKHSVIDEPIGPNNMRIKHAAVVELDPISFEFGASGANSVLQWIQASWRKDYSRRSGQINHADFNMNMQFEHQFSDALISETTFPNLEGASKDAAYVKVKCLPESVNTKRVGGSQKLRPIYGTKQKMWLCSGFRLSIDGIDEMKYTNKIDSFTIKQGIKSMYVGSRRYPELTPTKVEFPNLNGTISLAHAGGLLSWFDSYVQQGAPDRKSQRTGALEFLSSDRTSVIFRINLKEVGIASATVLQSQANSDQIQRIKFELYCGSMDLDGQGALGLE